MLKHFLSVLHICFPFLHMWYGHVASQASTHGSRGQHLVSSPVYLHLTNYILSLLLWLGKQAVYPTAISPLRDHRQVPPWQFLIQMVGSQIKTQALILTQAYLSTESSLWLTVSLLLVPLARHTRIIFRVKCKIKMLGSRGESVMTFKMVVAREKARCKLFWACLAAEGACLRWRFWSHGTLWVFLFRLTWDSNWNSLIPRLASGSSDFKTRVPALRSAAFSMFICYGSF